MVFISLMTALGHPYIMEMNLSRMIFSDVATTLTEPSGRFMTSPLIFSFWAILLIQLRNPTFWTLPDIWISIVCMAIQRPLAIGIPRISREKGNIPGKQVFCRENNAYPDKENKGPLRPMEKIRCAGEFKKELPSTAEDR
jgi:hypothetical protein